MGMGGIMAWPAAAMSESNARAMDLVADIYRRHGKSRQAESRRICALLQAIVAALNEQQTECKPVALFAALVLTLEGSLRDARAGAEGDQAAAMQLLEEVCQHMSVPALRLKIDRSVGIVSQVMQVRAQDDIQSPHTLKCAIGCLAVLLSAQDPNNYPSWAPSFALLVRHVVDSRPKIRKKAYLGLTKVFEALQNSKGLAPASKQVSSFVQQTINSLIALAAEKVGKKKEYEEKLQNLTTSTFHILGAMKDVLAFLEAAEALAIVQCIETLTSLQHPLLAYHSSQVIQRFFQSPRLASEMKPEIIIGILDHLVSHMLIINGLMSDTDLSSGMLNIISSGYHALHQIDRSSCLRGLPKFFHQCLNCLKRNKSDVFKVKVSQTLSELMTLCISKEVAAEALMSSNGQSKSKHPVVSIITSVEAMLMVSYQESWNVAFQLVSRLAKVLGHDNSSLIVPLLQEIGQLAAGPENQWTASIHECIGNAVRELGPAAVLEALPLGIVEAVEKGTEANSWLVFILKKNVYGASLNYWSTNILPLARKVGEFSAESREKDDIERSVLLNALEHQLWQTLPAFCRWPTDTASHFQTLARPLGAALQNRPDLRNYVCNALICLIQQNTTILKESNEDEDDVQSMSNFDDFDFDMSFPVPDSYTGEVAQTNLDAVAKYAKNFLPLLFNLFVSSKPSERGPLHATISAFGKVTDSSVLDGFYKNILKRMASAIETKDGDNKKEAAMEQQAMLMDIADALVPGLGTQPLEALLNIASVSIKSPASGIQKKSYKLLYSILKKAQDSKSLLLLSVQGALADAQSVCTTPARKNRLLCLREMVSLLGSNIGKEGAKERDAMTSMVTEIVMCTKEKNKKARDTALDLLADIASNFKGLTSVEEGPMLEAGPYGFINLVASGLVASHPHVISATILALTRLVYQYSSSLSTEVINDVQRAVSSLLRTKSREVVKSVLGFLNMYVTILDSASLHTQLSELIENLLIWANDSKNRFRLKIKYILEKMIRTVGMEEVTNHIPEEHQPLIRYIRKQNAREKRKRDGSVASEAGFSVRSRDTNGKGTTWTYPLDDEEDDDGGMSRMKSMKSMKSSGKSMVYKRQKSKSAMKDMDDREPTNLLDSKQVVRFNLLKSRDEDMEDDDFEIKLSKSGKMIIKDDRYEKREYVKDDSDENDAATVRSRSTFKSRAKSQAKSGKSIQSGKSIRSAKGTKTKIIGGQKFKSRKAGGDVKGNSRVEPFAYWPFDRRMLNRRNAKRKEGKKELLNVVKKNIGKKR